MARGYLASQHIVHTPGTEGKTSCGLLVENPSTGERKSLAKRESGQLVDALGNGLTGGYGSTSRLCARCEDAARPKITTRLWDRDHEAENPADWTDDYQVLADGEDTEWTVARRGLDHTELRNPRGDTVEWLPNDLRSALPRARAMVARRI